MKQHPRIYSLSTIGLIHHQEFDYLFHPFRTDFIGESGSGKSMIADLIQLILVGSEAFESATRGTDIREPQGMVLPMGKGNKGVGYVFLNIEIKPAQYLVVGSYLETGNRNTQGFIVQAGYDWQNVQYLSAPLSFQHFLKKEEEILPMDLLTDHIDEQGFHLKSWQRYKEFHKILFREKIIPLDLSSSDRLLNDYAGILQSFSRGKMLNTQKSDSLKQFLFGNEETKKILDNYKNAEKDMEQAIGEYGHNLHEIERVTAKQKALTDLMELKKQRDDQQHTWMYWNLLFYHQEATRQENEVNDIITQYTSAMLHQTILEELLADEISKIQEKLPILKKEKEDIELKYENILPAYNQVNQVLDWLSKLNCTYDVLETRYKEYKQNKKEKLMLEPFFQTLQQKQLTETFDNISAKWSAIELNAYLIETIAERQHRIEQKKRLKKYANINDSESLAYWALQQKRAFTMEEESAILHFQDLPRNKPDNLEEYLPEPAKLILSLSIAEMTDNGFWITLNGIRRYIPYAPEQILNTIDEEKIRSYFELYSNTLDADIYELEKKLKIFMDIQDLISLQDNLPLILSAYSRKEMVYQHIDIPSLNISEERFHEYQEIYLQREIIKKQFIQVKSEKEHAEQELGLMNDTMREYRSIQTSSIISKPNDAIRLVLDGFKDIETHSDTYRLEKENLSASLSRSANKPDFFRNQGQLIQPALSGIQALSSLKNTLDSNKVGLEKAKEQYLKWYERLPESLESGGYITEPKVEYTKYITAEEKFFLKYNSIVEFYIAAEAYRFVDSKDFTELAKNLLPEAFYEAVVDQSETNVIDMITAYLTRINEKNRQLNNRKIQKIKNLLDEVDEIITQQENTIRRIDNFLRKDAQITGGYSARLRREPATSYPKNWMSIFKEMIEDESGALQSKLGEKIDLTEMMKTAFYDCGGSPHTNATVNKLLDPFNYYGLSFNMESESGRVNKGSTGQTYAAIALLCIARLSIMTSEEGKAIEPAVRVMPIDEAEGLGANYDMLYDIAKKYDYQLISLSIGPVGKFKDGEQYLYMLHKNMEVEEPVNYPPMAILCEKDKISNYE